MSDKIRNINACHYANITEAKAAYEKSPEWARTKVACPKMLLEDGQPNALYFRGAFEQWLWREVDAEEMAEIEKRLRDMEPKMREIAETSPNAELREAARKWLELKPL